MGINDRYMCLESALIWNGKFPISDPKSISQCPYTRFVSSFFRRHLRETVLIISALYTNSIYGLYLYRKIYKTSIRLPYRQYTNFLYFVQNKLFRSNLQSLQETVVGVNCQMIVPFYSTVKTHV